MTELMSCASHLVLNTHSSAILSYMDLFRVCLIGDGWVQGQCNAPAGAKRRRPERERYCPLLTPTADVPTAASISEKPPGLGNGSAPYTRTLWPALSKSFTPGSSCRLPVQVFLQNPALLGSIFPYCECVRLYLTCTNPKTTDRIHCS